MADDDFAGITTGLEAAPTRAPHAAEHLTDMGNAKRLVAAHGKDLRYCPATRDWFVWDDRRYVRDQDGEVIRRAKQVVLAIHDEARDAGDAATRKALSQHAVRSESEPRLMAMVSLARSEPGIPITVAEFDAHPMLVTVANGTLDLEIGALRESRREDFLTQMVDVHFDPSAKCPRFDAFLDRVMQGDRELVTYLQRAIGYTLTGHTGEQVLFLLHGLGANGKSVLLELLQRLLGDLAVRIDFDSLLDGRRSGPRNDLAVLPGKRLAVASEAGEGRRFDEAVVKSLTGGDTITCRRLYGEPFSFAPQAKFWLAANALPEVRSIGEATWRRLRQIPFSVTIPVEERDPRLLDRLSEELPGILTWAVAGCLAWQREGLGGALAVTTATATYRDDMDLLGAFLAQETIPDATARSSAADLYSRYSTWAARTNERALSQRALGLRLAERGYHRIKDARGCVAWIGMRLTGATEEGTSVFTKSPHEGNTKEVCEKDSTSSVHPPFRVAA